jgi:hypothetical protein
MRQGQSSDFDLPDNEGIVALCEETFVRYLDMLFLHSSFDEATIDHDLKNAVPKHRIQHERNHRDLIMFAGVVAEQRKEAEAIRERWLNRTSTEFPDLYVHVTVEYSIDDVVISLRASKR